MATKCLHMVAMVTTENSQIKSILWLSSPKNVLIIMKFQKAKWSDLSLSPLVQGTISSDPEFPKLNILNGALLFNIFIFRFSDFMQKF